MSDCLKTKANYKTEGVNSDQPKIVESIFLSKFLMCSQDHQNLKEIGSPQRKQCINAYHKNSKEKKRAANNKQNNQQQNEQNRKNKKPSRLSNLDVSEFMVENNIKSETELFAIADEQKKAGKKDLANFVLSRSTKAISDLLENTRKMGGLQAKTFFLLKTNLHGSDS